MKFLFILFTVLAVGACSYEEPKKNPEEETKEKIFAVQMQLVGSIIEGLTVCFDENNTCKKTNNSGMVEFENFGKYSFKIRDINLSTLEIDTNRTIVSPYTLFDKNETLAKRSVLLLHAFDKGKTIDDEQVLLSLSSYIPDIKDFPSLLAESKVELIPKDINEILNLNNTDSNNSENNDTNDTSRFAYEYELLRYTTNEFNITDNANEHNITINFTESNITRDGKDSHIVIPDKSSYESLDNIMKFVDLAVDKNVTIDNFEEKYLLTKNSLTSFNLGDKYVVNAIVKEDHVVLEFFENSSRIKDETILIETDEDNILLTSMLNLRLDEIEKNLD